MLNAQEQSEFKRFEDNLTKLRAFCVARTNEQTEMPGRWNELLTQINDLAEEFATFKKNVAEGIIIRDRRL